MGSILWHDYETFGANPRRDRPCQFAALRTDEDLNIIDDPIDLFCKPAPDFLPDPGSVAITGITPQQALQQGLPEAEFSARIAQQFLDPGTCGAGYNSLRFDDEVTRHLLYRNFHDVYEREWKNGNSRWDLIDVLRMTQALRPDGIQWPLRDDGAPSFRLEDLTRANGIEHGDAHDALADVRATIAMAQLVKQAQPKLYEFLYHLRSKHRVLPLLDLARQEPVLHVSRMFPASRGCLGVVIPLCKHPRNPNGIIVADLLSDPTPWLELDAATLQEKLFTRTAERSEGEARIMLKTVHINRCPALAPLNVLNEQVQKRYPFDLAAADRNRAKLLAARGLVQRLQQVFGSQDHEIASDPDLMLYNGFFDDHDRRLAEKVRHLQPEQLATVTLSFHDGRLPEMLFRYRARNFPETLSPAEQLRWREHCRSRLSGELPGAGLARAAFDAALVEHADRLGAELVSALHAYAEQIGVRAQ